jgi:hypothetical protein
VVWDAILVLEAILKAKYEAKGEAVKRLDSRFYDEELKMFVVKRIDGCQYFDRGFGIFRTLPKTEVKALAKMKLNHRPLELNANSTNLTEGKDFNVPFYIKDTRKEVTEGKYKYWKPQKGKVVKVKKLGSKEKCFKVKYKPVKCVTKIPLKKFHLNFLDDLKEWFVDAETSEAVMMDNKDYEMMRNYDPMSLIYLSEDDLQMLTKVMIMYHKTWEPEGRQYQRVVRFCVKKGIFAHRVGRKR